MAGPGPCCNFNYYGHCKFSETCRQDHLKETCPNIPCKLENGLKRHPKLCKNFSKSGVCRFDISCPFLHKPHKLEQICEEVKLLKTEIEALKAHNESLESEVMPQPFNCVNCEYNFRSHDSIELLDHCRNVHSWFMCRNWMAGDRCEYETTNAEDLETHMKNSCEFKHHYKSCDVCDKTIHFQETHFYIMFGLINRINHPKMRTNFH